jgi:hypothetical protein
MLAEREAEPSSPGRTEEARTLDPERVEDCESVRNPSDELVVARIAWLVASALTSVVGEDQSDFAAQRLSEAGCLRDLEADRRSRCRREPAGPMPAASSKHVRMPSRGFVANGMPCRAL